MSHFICLISLLAFYCLTVSANTSPARFTPQQQQQSGQQYAYHKFVRRSQSQAVPYVSPQALPPQPQPHPQPRLQPQPVPQSQPLPRPQPQPQAQSQSQPRLQPVSLPQVPPPPPPSDPQHSNYIVNGYHKITTLPDMRTRFIHSYNNDERGNYEVRSWVDPAINAHGRSIQEYRSPQYDYRSFRDVNAVPAYKPELEPTGHFQRPSYSLVPLPDSHLRTYSEPNPQPAPYHQGYYRGSRGQSNELTSPVFMREVTTQPDAVNILVGYIKSPNFLNTIGSLGSQNLFQKTIVADNRAEDLQIINSNIAKTGLNFSLDGNDCKPELKTVKFGLINEPEVIFNPSSVQIKRCSQGCWSWQFDCIPTSKVTHNITVTMYTITENKQVNREVIDFAIEEHTSCGCSCQTFAGCFGNTKFSSTRLPPSNQS